MKKKQEALRNDFDRINAVISPCKPWFIIFLWTHIELKWEQNKLSTYDNSYSTYDTHTTYEYTYISTHAHTHAHSHILQLFLPNGAILSGLSLTTYARYFFNLSRKLSGLYTEQGWITSQTREKQSTGWVDPREATAWVFCKSGSNWQQLRRTTLRTLHPKRTQEKREHNSGHKFIPGGPGIPCIPGKPLEKQVFN